MKRNIKHLCVATTFIMLSASCASDFSEPSLQDDGLKTPRQEREGYSAEELKEMGAAFFSGTTRGDFDETPSIEPIANLKATRSDANSNDTIAYVLNYPESKRFIVVANDKNVSPILAYSEENLFDQTNPIIQEEFIANIPEYLASATETRGASKIGGNTNPPIGQPDPPYKNVIGPYISTTMHGEYPFNKYFDSQKVFAGGLPLASGYILSQCKESLTYKGRTYDFASINEGLKSDENSTVWKNAADKMARLMYDFTMDMEDLFHNPLKPMGSESINYNKAFYSAYIELPMQKLLELGCPIPGIDYNEFNVETAWSHLQGKYILYVAGIEGYHYIIDGYAWTFSTPILPPTIGAEIPPLQWDHFFHCKWGFKNVNDGYYRVGEMDNTTGVVRPESYFRVRI